LDEAYNEKLEELCRANTDNNALLVQIEELEESHQSQIENLNVIYNSKISELEDLISSATKREIFELRVYRFFDERKSYYIYNAPSARDYFSGYVRNYQMFVPVEIVVLRDTNNQLQRAIAEHGYVNSDVDTILKDMAKDQIAYGFHWEGDYVIVWFIVWMFYEYP